MLNGLGSLLLWGQTILSSYHGAVPTGGGISDPAITIENQWDVLGPFQIGTREASWGADPLEWVGGFRNLSAADQSYFRSSLGTRGQVGWTRQSGRTAHKSRCAVEIEGEFAFDDIDWQTIRSFYGWSALQYQGWARTTVVVHESLPRNVALYTDGILEFWIDDLHFFGGDFYTFRRAPVIIPLLPGRHRLDIRLVRDVRSMGGSDNPTFPYRISVDLLDQELVINSKKALLPEIVRGRGLASHVASVPLHNAIDESIAINEITSKEGNFNLEMMRTGNLVIAPGQSRPLRFQLSTSVNTNSLEFEIIYFVGNSTQKKRQLVGFRLKERDLNEAFRFTFLHPSGTVSYAILACPSEELAFEKPVAENVPILLNLHGAGVEADSQLVRHQLDSVEDIQAWTLFPSGGNTWGGDDWHTWGSADVQAAIDAIPQVVQSIRWSGAKVDTSQLYVVGHSNGGQGTWYILTHKPDNIAAAAPVSGYSSIQAYVPYNMWTEVNPQVWMSLQSSLTSFRHELLLGNFAGIPIVQQHGGLDDNVPPFHSRRLAQLLQFSQFPSTYTELPGKGHWFNGVMTTPQLRGLYQRIGKSNGSIPSLPGSFRLVVPHSADMGSRGGIQVDQLLSPDTVGVLEVDQVAHPAEWLIKTSNVHRFHFADPHNYFPSPTKLNIDGVSLTFDNVLNKSFLRLDDGSWKISSVSGSLDSSQRHGAQIGALDAILRSRDTFLIQNLVQFNRLMALQVARNLFQYFGADSRIVEDTASSPSWEGNIISLALGRQDSFVDVSHPFKISPTGLRIAQRDTIRTLDFEPGMGAIYLVPRPDGALELRIWGYDERGLKLAARLFPMLTGVGQPDFVVVSDECRWKGAGGVRGTGFFDYEWKISKASYIA